MVVVKTENICFNNNKIKDNVELMLVILNYTVLHNQNYGWTLPNPYFRARCKNIYLIMLFKKARIVW